MITARACPRCFGDLILEGGGPESSCIQCGHVSYPNVGTEIVTAAPARRGAMQPVDRRTVRRRQIVRARAREERVPSDLGELTLDPVYLGEFSR